MSRSIDHRTVEMNFNNRQFENGIKDSLDSLADLKKGLDFGGETLTDLNRGGLSGLADSIEEITSKFSILGIIGVTALAKITSAAMDTGASLIKSLAFEPLTTGFDKYTMKTEAVQTILNATGLTLEEVNEELNKLNWFTDETSYNFADMVGNIGKFTSSGVDLGTAVTAMQGIATWAAISGQNVGEAGRAMYNLSQSIGIGGVKLIDWKSIENANMATKEFKEIAIETAIAMGTLNKKSESSKGNLVDFTNFSSTLQDGWFTADVLLATLDKYGSFADEVYALSTEKGITAYQAMELLSDGTFTLGERAFRAAQQAKTFKESIEATKDAVSSGWMNTAEIIFGDYHEAVELWSDLTDALWEVFASGAEGRNEMLQEWKDLGGRDDLIEAFWNIWEAVEKIATTIKEAFHEIFPPMTAERLFAITEALKLFTERLIISDETADNLRDTFKGFFAILRIGRRIVGAITRVIGKFLKILWPAGDGILSLTAGLGQWLVSIDEAIEESGVLNGIVERLGAVFEGVGEAVSNAVEWVGTFIKSLGGLDLAAGGFEGFIYKLQRFFIDLGLLFKGVFIKDLQLIVESFWHVMAAVFGEKTADILTEALVTFTRFVADLKLLFKGIFIGDLQLIVESFWHVMAAVFGEKIADVLTDFVDDILYSESKLVDAFVSMGNSAEKFGGIFGLALYNAKWAWHAFREGYQTGETEMVTGTLTAFATMGNALFLFEKAAGPAFATIGNVLRGFAEKVKLLFKDLTFLEVVELIKTILGGGLMVVIGKFIYDASQVATGFRDILGELESVLVSYQRNLKSGALLRIAIAIAILVASLVALSLIDPDKLASALVAMTLVFGELLFAMSMFNKLSSLSLGFEAKAILLLIGMGIAISILANAVRKLSKIDPDAAMNGVVVIASLAGVLVGLARYLDKNTSGIAKAAFGFMIFGASLYILIGAIKILGKMDTDVLTKGLISTGALMAAIVIFVNNLETSGLKPSTALIFIGLAIALVILAQAVKQMGRLSLGELAKGLIGLAGALGILVYAVNELPLRDMVAGGIGLVIMGAGLWVLSKALQSFAGIEWDVLGRGLIALGGSLGILAIALDYMKNAVPGAIALGIAAAALWLLVPVLIALGSLPLKTIGTGLLALAGIFLVFGVAGALLASIAVPLLVLAAALLLVGAAMYLVGAGMLKFALGLAALAVLGSAGVAAVSALVMGIIALLPKILAKVGESLMILLRMLIAAGPLFFETLVVLFTGMVDAAIVIIPKAVEAVFLLITTVLDTVLEQLPRLIDVGIKIIIALMQGFVSRTPAMVNAGIDLILAFIRGISSKLPDIIDTALKVIISFINGLANAIRTNSKALSNAIANLATAIVQAIFNLMSTFWTIGEDIVKGMISGIAAMGRRLATAATNIVKGAVTAVKNYLGMSSPSKVFAKIGENTGLGLVIGLRSMTGGVEGASENLGKTAVSSLKDSFSKISDILDTDVDLTPTITPVLDMSEVERDLKSTFNKTQDLDVSTSAANAHDISRIARQRASETADSGTRTENTDNSSISITNHYHVRDDNDIRKISYELRNVLDRYNLAKGVPA